MEKKDKIENLYESDDDVNDEVSNSNSDSNVEPIQNENKFSKLIKVM
jgi:hypothetical protein